MNGNGKWNWHLGNTMPDVGNALIDIQFRGGKSVYAKNPHAFEWCNMNSPFEQHIISWRITE